MHLRPGHRAGLQLRKQSIGSLKTGDQAKANAKRRRCQRVLEAVVLLSSDLEDERVADQLVNNGCSEAEAWKLIVLVPMAFARVIFEPAGVQFYKHYLTVTSTGSKRRHGLAAERVYQEARRYGQRLAATHRVEALYQVVRRSADYCAIQELHRAGSLLPDILLADPAVMLAP